VSYHYLGLFKCTAPCGRTTLEDEHYTEQSLEERVYEKQDGIVFKMGMYKSYLFAGDECAKRLK
jgi:hypothetical protein